MSTTNSRRAAARTSRSSGPATAGVVGGSSARSGGGVGRGAVISGRSAAGSDVVSVTSGVADVWAVRSPSSSPPNTVALMAATAASAEPMSQARRPRAVARAVGERDSLAAVEGLASGWGVLRDATAGSSIAGSSIASNVNWTSGPRDAGTLPIVPPRAHGSTLSSPFLARSDPVIAPPDSQAAPIQAMRRRLSTPHGRPRLPAARCRWDVEQFAERAAAGPVGPDEQVERHR
jgi:hypothetical protein